MKTRNGEKGIFGRMLVLLAVLVMIAGCLCGCGDAAPKGKTVAEKYSDAQALLSVGKYAEAAAAFDELGDYEDAARLAMYSRAAALGENGQYDAAITAFESFGDYKSSREMAVYYRAREREAGYYPEDAIVYYEDILLFKDSAQRIENIKKQMYDLSQSYADAGYWDRAASGFDYLWREYRYSDSNVKAEWCRNEPKYRAALQLKADGKYEEAIAAFGTLGDYSDSKARITECEAAIAASIEEKYQAALQLKADGKYEEAIAAFEALGDYSDSKARIAECEAAITEQKYQASLQLKADGKYEEAIVAFKALGDYSDSKARIAECETAIKEEKYQAANALKAAGDYTRAYEIYAAITGYKDVDSIIANDENISAAEAAARLAALKTPGEYVTFGNYYQSNSSTKEPIEWLVLDYDAGTNRALVISRYALDCKRYNEKYVDITWETCTLRTWLNGEFLSAAFSIEEQKAIPTVTVSADKNPSYSTNPGNATQDKVFCLSIAEVNKYFKNDEARMCAPTQYAINNNAYTSSSFKVDGKATCYWWLRSPGRYGDYAADVNGVGYVDSFGNSVNYSSSAVRPALYIDLNLIP